MYNVHERLSYHVKTRALAFFESAVPILSPKEVFEQRRNKRPHPGGLRGY